MKNRKKPQPGIFFQIFSTFFILKLTCQELLLISFDGSIIYNLSYLKLYISWLLTNVTIAWQYRDVMINEYPQSQRGLWGYRRKVGSNLEVSVILQDPWNLNRRRINDKRGTAFQVAFSGEFFSAMPVIYKARLPEAPENSSSCCVQIQT